MRLGASPEEWDQRSFGPILTDFERRFRATGTEEGVIMATVLTYVRQDSLTSPAGTSRRSFRTANRSRALFERGVDDRDATIAIPAE